MAKIKKAEEEADEIRRKLMEKEDKNKVANQGSSLLDVLNVDSNSNVSAGRDGKKGDKKEWKGKVTEEEKSKAAKFGIRLDGL